MIIPIIMAGGTGSRLWPLSRELYPKQFLTLNGKYSMLQSTIKRLDGLDINLPIIICNESHRFIVAEQLRNIEKLSNNIILEPCARNTAPAIALAAMDAIRKDKDAVLVVLAADHLIENVEEFKIAVEKSILTAKKGYLVTFGIVPDKAETGYGYIHKGKQIEEFDDSVHSINKFVEKPSTKIAEEYLSDGGYLWNSGMFAFRASVFLDELKKYRPEIFKYCMEAFEANTVDKTEDFIRINKDIFEKCPEESIDYAVMENTDKGVVISLDAKWNDIGSWSALWEVNEKNTEYNFINGDVFTHKTTNSYIYSDHQFTAVLGMDNIVVVNTKDSLLIADKNEVQDVKKIVNYLKENRRPEFKSHRETFKLWGKTDRIVNQDRYKVNTVVVKPGGIIGSQMHHHRAEHWIVLAGIARVTINGKVQLLTENQSTFISAGAQHMLENPGLIDLEIIEIQSGSYLNENDIVRY